MIFDAQFQSFAKGENWLENPRLEIRWPLLEEERMKARVWDRVADVSHAAESKKNISNGGKLWSESVKSWSKDGKLGTGGSGVNRKAGTKAPKVPRDPAKGRLRALVWQGLDTQKRARFETTGEEQDDTSARASWNDSWNSDAKHDDEEMERRVMAHSCTFEFWSRTHWRRTDAPQGEWTPDGGAWTCHGYDEQRTVANSERKSLSCSHHAVKRGIHRVPRRSLFLFLASDGGYIILVYSSQGKALQEYFEDALRRSGTDELVAVHLEDHIFNC